MIALGIVFSALLLGVLYKRPITALLDRINQLNIGNVSLSSPQQSIIGQTKPEGLEASTKAEVLSLGRTENLETSTPVDEFFSRNSDPAFQPFEQNIVVDLKNLGLEIDTTTDKILIRALARNQVKLHCEVAYRIMYGSQYDLLISANGIG